MKCVEIATALLLGTLLMGWNTLLSADVEEKIVVADGDWKQTFLTLEPRFMAQVKGDAPGMEALQQAFLAELERDPQQPLWWVYLGSCETIEARYGWCSWSRVRNLESGLDKIDRALAQLKPHHKEERVGLSPYADHRPDHISGGQRQRVAIARALVKRPQLVVADEPTANLDSTTATQIIELMHEIAREQQTTFLVATHDPRMAERCETQLELVDGEVV